MLQQQCNGDEEKNRMPCLPTLLRLVHLQSMLMPHSGTATQVPCRTHRSWLTGLITRRNIWWLRLCSEHGSQSCGADGGKFSVLATFFSGYGIKPPGIQSFKLCPWYIKYTRWDILRMPGLWETVGELGEIWNYHKCREKYWKVWNRWLKFGK